MNKEGFAAPNSKNRGGKNVDIFDVGDPQPTLRGFDWAVWGLERNDHESIFSLAAFQDHA